MIRVLKIGVGIIIYDAAKVDENLHLRLYGCYTVVPLMLHHAHLCYIVVSLLSGNCLYTCFLYSVGINP